LFPLQFWWDILILGWGIFPLMTFLKHEHSQHSYTWSWLDTACPDQNHQDWKIIGCMIIVFFRDYIKIIGCVICMTIILIIILLTIF
jgi:hypothetical protein